MANPSTFCTFCGKPLGASGGRFCPSCGGDLASVNATQATGPAPVPPLSPAFAPLPPPPPMRSGGSSVGILAGLGVVGLVVVLVGLAFLGGVLPPKDAGGQSGAPNSSQTAAEPAPTLAHGPAGFSATGSMAHSRLSHTATSLRDGRVLIAGGQIDGIYGPDAEIYDPATGAFSPTGSMTHGRIGHAATLLSDGRVLITGGLPEGGSTSEATPMPEGSSPATAELYDPATGSFSATGQMAVARSGHKATLLGDGRVLITGGRVRSTQLASAELYDPATGKLSSTGSMGQARFAQTATLLRDGRVLVAGGVADVAGDEQVFASAELYDPATGEFSSTGSMGRAHSYATATLLGDGRVLIAGGYIGASDTYLGTAELYDPATGEFSSTGSMEQVRGFHAASLLPNGHVLIAGGMAVVARENQVLASAELYDPATGAFSSAGSMTDARSNHTATPLPDGRILIAGGYGSSDSDSGVGLASAELYQP